jgi:hypothetical protein
MKRKLFALTVLLGITVLASWAPRAEAYPFCDEICDPTTNPTTKCTCPPSSDRPGLPAACGGWYGRCYFI